MGLAAGGGARAAHADGGPDPGSFANPVWSPDGTRLALSGEDGDGVHVYDLRSGELLTITRARTSGAWMSWSPDGARLAFKLLADVPGDHRPAPMPVQIPVVFDVEQRRLGALADPTVRASVPAFAASGRLVFAIGERAVVLEADGRPAAGPPLRLGAYANLARLSPDGGTIAYNDGRDAIWLLDVATGKRRPVTTPGAGAWFDPRWSPDGRRLLLAGVGGGQLCVDLAEARATALPLAESASWLPDGETLVYASAEVPDGREAPGADLRLIRCDGGGDRALTDTPGVRETSPRVAPDGRRLVYRLDGALVVAPLVAARADAAGGARLRLGAAEPLLGRAAGPRARVEWRDAAGDLPALPAPAALPPLSTTEIAGVPYLHQLYDTRDDFDGNWACNATSAMMTIAFPGILPHWDITSSWPSPHTSHWGNYISEIYEWNGHTFDVGSADPDGQIEHGGYGYIVQGDWEDTKGHMAEYLTYHGLESSVDWSPSWDKLRAEVAAGDPFVMLSSITSAGHYKVVIGHHDEVRAVVFNDPYGNKNVAYPSPEGAGAIYDWPGYSNGHKNLNTVWCFIWARAPEPQAGSVIGTVRDATTGEPVAAEVSLDAGPTTVAGPDGAYRFDGLAAGSYTVTAEAACHGPASASAVVVAGEEAIVDLSVAPDGSCAPDAAAPATHDAGRGELIDPPGPGEPGTLLGGCRLSPSVPSTPSSPRSAAPFLLLLVLRRRRSRDRIR